MSWGGITEGFGVGMTLPGWGEGRARRLSLRSSRWSMVHDRDADRLRAPTEESEVPVTACHAHRRVARGLARTERMHAHLRRRAAVRRPRV